MTEAEPSGIAIGRFYAGGGVVYDHAIYVSAGNKEGAAAWVFGPYSVPAYRLSLTKAGTGDGTVTSQPSGINCGTARGAEYELEEVVTLYALPDAHSNFAGWSVEGPGDEPCPGVGSCTVTVFGDTDVRANFEAAPEQTLTVSARGEGTVESEPAGISCPGKCSEEFAEGRTISLLAKPGPHTRVTSWSGCSFRPNANECKVTMSDAKEVSVEFAPIPAETLRVSVAGPGQVLSYPAGIFCPGRCSAGFDEGSTVYLIPSPDPGSLFAGWQGAGGAGTSLCPVSMQAAESVSGKFETGLPPVETIPPASRPGPRDARDLVAQDPPQRATGTDRNGLERWRSEHPQPLAAAHAGAGERPGGGGGPAEARRSGQRGAAALAAPSAPGQRHRRLHAELPWRARLREKGCQLRGGGIRCSQ
jgi:List-Bact-rpt repeat protein